MIHVTASQIEAVVAERISEYLQECDALLDEIMSRVARAGPITHTGSGCGFCSRAITALTGAATDQFPFETRRGRPGPSASTSRVGWSFPNQKNGMRVKPLLVFKEAAQRSGGLPTLIPFR
jgi:hypothetical protein